MEKQKQRQGKEIWAGHIQKWTASGMSRRQYCIGAAISYWTFREWQKRLNEEKPAGENFVKLPFVQIDSTVIGDPTIELSLPGDISIRIRKEFDGELLRALLRELGVNR